MTRKPGFAVRPRRVRFASTTALRPILALATRARARAAAMLTILIQLGKGELLMARARAFHVVTCSSRSDI